MNAWEWLFWGALALAAYAFAGYPVLAIVLARLRGGTRGARGAHSAGVPAGPQPHLTVVVAARNEAAAIADRVRNLLDSDYPADRLRVLVADDGSSDGTAAAVAALDDARVRVVRLEHASGKAVALNAAMATVDTPLTVFADARQRFRPDALARLVQGFDEARVGAVAGELLLTRPTMDAAATAPAAQASPVAANGAYWKLERALREAEGTLGWAHAASGAIYALRTALFRPLPAGLLLDDVYTPLQVVRSGHLVRVERNAVAHEPAGTDLLREFRRKLRTLTGNWQLLALQPWLLHPLRNPVFFAWASHKFARLLAPWALLAALLASAMAATTTMQAAFVLQLLAYCMALASLCFPVLARRIPLAGTAGSFLALNAAALLSLPLWLGRRDLGALWKR